MTYLKRKKNIPLQKGGSESKGIKPEREDTAVVSTDEVGAAAEASSLTKEHQQMKSLQKRRNDEKICW